MAGNNTLDGGAGNDLMDSGFDSDIYLCRKQGGRDHIYDYGQTGDQDQLKLVDAGKTDPVLVKQGSDLYVMLDKNNYIDIDNQISKPDYGIERLQISDGHYITRMDIDNIIHAMSSVNDNIGMDLMQKFNAMKDSSEYRNVLAAHWQQA